jgi:alkanesulfonate monooxygenase SsuD/methylene tetrahydromethanopterin reductase-like flavin-dependent oxidoreductase (luciferase family)
MKFGYFTLSDNNYRDNPRGPNAFVLDIVDEAMHAENWATMDLLSGGRVDFATGRGYDRREYEPFEVSFEENAAIFAEGLEIVQRLWNTEGLVSHKGKYYNFEDVWITPLPVQKPLPIYVAAFSRPTVELACRLGLGLVVAAGQASAMHGSLVATAQLYRDTCAKFGTTPKRMITSYFIHFADTPEEERRARERQLRYHKECTSPAFPGDPKNAPENYHYFQKIVEKYQTQKPEDFNANNVLLGNSQQIIDALKTKVEAAGFDEVILYFNLGLKPHARVKDEMSRFMEEVAPYFA